MEGKSFKICPSEADAAFKEKVKLKSTSTAFLKHYITVKFDEKWTKDRSKQQLLSMTILDSTRTNLTTERSDERGRDEPPPCRTRQRLKEKLRFIVHILLEDFNVHIDNKEHMVKDPHVELCLCLSDYHPVPFHCRTHWRIWTLPSSICLRIHIWTRANTSIPCSFVELDQLYGLSPQNFCFIFCKSIWMH